MHNLCTQGSLRSKDSGALCACAGLPHWMRACKCGLCLQVWSALGMRKLFFTSETRLSVSMYILVRFLVVRFQTTPPPSSPASSTCGAHHSARAAAYQLPGGAVLGTGVAPYCPAVALPYCPAVALHPAALAPAQAEEGGGRVAESVGRAAAGVEREEERAGDVSAGQEGRALMIGWETRARECTAHTRIRVGETCKSICRVRRL